MIFHMDSKTIKLIGNYFVSTGFLVALMSVAFSTGVMAAEKRPKICLVLSGGGARGAAHVGVLKVLEEYRVPIDCIVGTSMGSLVGAAYATGTTLPEMDTLLANINSEILFKESPPRKELAMRRKQDDYTLLFGPELGVTSDGLAVGKGVVTGVQLETVLRKLTKEKGYRKFDDLPIQYRAVATDLVTGTAVVFSEGDLASVMRASMSVPGAVAPAEYKGMLLVDGMLTSNLPVQSARELGADIIIAVNVGTPLLRRDQLNGIFGVTAQMLSILTEQNVQTSLASMQANDILISPELGNFTTADFDHLSEISPLGEVAARKVADRLKAISISSDDFAALRQRQQFATQPAPEPVDEIRFEKMQRVNSDTAKAVMRTKAADPIDQQTLDTDMRALYGTGDFEHVGYRYLDDHGKRVLVVDAAEKQWGPDYLRFGLGLATDFSGDSSFNILASYRETWLNSLGAEWRTDVQFGEVNSIGTEFYQPLNTDGLFFIAPYMTIEQNNIDLYQNNDRIANYSMLTKLVGLDIGSHIYRYGEMRLGVLGGEVEPTLDTGPSYLEPEDDHITQGAFIGSLILDQLDSVHFPRSGWRTQVGVIDSTETLGAEDNYARWDASFSSAISVGEHTFNFALAGGDNIGSDPLPSYAQFQSGGFLNQSGFADGQFAGESKRFGRVMYYRRIMRGGMLEGAYGGFSLEAGRIEDSLIPGNEEDWVKSGSLFIGADSPLGPMYLGYGITDEGKNQVYFYLGLPYR